MTIETIVRCDGLSCCNECEIEDAYDSSVSDAVAALSAIQSGSVRHITFTE